MNVLRTIKELDAWRGGLPTANLGFVPTMGALHAGHLSLVAASRASSDVTVASIFVNPAQFGPNEDLEKYPRPLDEDLHLLESEGADAVFVPSVETIYPPDFSTFVEETRLSQHLCGPFRPGHFRGVATVVVRLLNLIRPDAAFFGQKDYQQVLIIARVARDLGLGVAILMRPTVREPDGLAMSSRNRYLSPEERKAATLVYRSLQTASEAMSAGEMEAESLQRIGRCVLAADPLIGVQYWEVADRRTLEPVQTAVGEETLLATAVRIGKTRLIDNVLV